MKKDKMKKIEAKVRLGLPLTKKEKSYYSIFAKALDLAAINAALKL